MIERRVADDDAVGRRHVNPSPGAETCPGYVGKLGAHGAVTPEGADEEETVEPGCSQLERCRTLEIPGEHRERAPGIVCQVLEHPSDAGNGLHSHDPARECLAHALLQTSLEGRQGRAIELDRHPPGEQELTDDQRVGLTVRAHGVQVNLDAEHLAHGVVKRHRALYRAEDGPVEVEQEEPHALRLAKPHREKVAEASDEATSLESEDLVDLVHVCYEPEGVGPHATIVALHGWGASAFDLVGLAPYLAGGRFQVLCPQGPLTVPLGPTVGYGWFPLTTFGPGATESAMEEATDRVRAFLDAASARYAIAPRKLVLLGFSQGGILAYRLALAEPARFAGLVALSSWLPPPMLERLALQDSYDQLPTFIQHGSDDEIIAVARARQSVEALRALRLPLTYREYSMGHEINAKSLHDLSNWLEERVLAPITLA